MPNTLRRHLLAAAALASMGLASAACNAAILVPNPVGGGGGVASGGPTLQGEVNKPAGSDGAKLRVALVGALRAGAAKEELTSAAAPSGKYSLILPGQPAVKFLEAPAEDRSIVFSLVAYSDTNGNARFDEGVDLLHQGTTATGTFRYFAADGPAGTYKAGWNLFKDGAYTQGFESLAFNVTTG